MPVASKNLPLPRVTSSISINLNRYFYKIILLRNQRWYWQLLKSFFYLSKFWTELKLFWTYKSLTNYWRIWCLYWKFHFFNVNCNRSRWFNEMRTKHVCDCWSFCSFVLWRNTSRNEREKDLRLLHINMMLLFQYLSEIDVNEKKSCEECLFYLIVSQMQQLL